ncbi:MAG: hypothetical protein ACXVBW_08780, partial [Bdellovibrionota bacterium]
MKRIVLGLAFVAAAGCSGTGLPNFNNLESLRVVAMVLDQPEISATVGIPATVTLTPLVSDVN